MCPGLALCGALSLYTDKDTVNMLSPTCIINCAGELPDTPLPDTVKKYHKVRVIDSPETDLRPHIDQVVDLLHQVTKLWYPLIIEVKNNIATSFHSNWYISMIYSTVSFWKHTSVYKINGKKNSTQRKNIHDIFTIFFDLLLASHSIIYLQN